MSDVDTQPANDPAPAIGRLPSPGCLFTVTLLLIVVSVCGWIGWRVHQQQARLAYFERIGAVVETEPARPVWLHDLVLSTLGEEAAVGFTDVTRLSLSRTTVTQTGLLSLDALTHLQFLDLGNTQVTDADLALLSGLTDLDLLYLHDTQVTDDGLRHLSGLTNLRELSLDGTRVTDAGLQELTHLANLKVVFLDKTQVTDAGVEELRSQLPGVEFHH